MSMEQTPAICDECGFPIVLGPGQSMVRHTITDGIETRHVGWWHAACVPDMTTPAYTVEAIKGDKTVAVIPVHSDAHAGILRRALTTVGYSALSYPGPPTHE